MQFASSLARLWKDPGPGYLFEISEAGIAFAKPGAPPETGFESLEPDVLSVSPLHDNVLRPDALSAHVRNLIPANGKGKRRAALILPDYAARVAVFDFDSLPAGAEERNALVRFRMKKSVPFDVDSAVVSHYVQPASRNGKIEVVVAVIALEIVARYEAPFRAAGYLPGQVTTSSLAALRLAPRAPEEAGPVVFAKLSGRVLTVMALLGRHLKLVRSVELDAATVEDVMDLFHPTFAYIEDALGAPARKLLLCGFGPLSEQVAQQCQSEAGVSVERLRSQFGSPGPCDAGLLGMLEGSVN